MLQPVARRPPAAPPRRIDDNSGEMMSKTALPTSILFLALGFAAPSLLADEGLWLFNDFPTHQVKDRYGFEVTDTLLDHIRLSSTRLNNGGSGSFVSPNGLVFTNHHVASDCIQKLTTAENDYIRDGFHAATQAEEKACPDLEINVLVGISDVTGKVKVAAPENAPAAEANRLRKAAMTKIEKECTDSTGNRCDVETLYSGGQYHLYQYSKYTDVRLVFAPEASIAAFGGDPDNFTYPRYCLDFTFFRVYENGRPAKVDHYLPWSREGVKDGELTFVSGHPGATGRLLTYAALEFYRDVSYPLVLRRLESLSKTLLDYSGESDENRRVARDNLLHQTNSLKAYIGFLAGLRDPGLMSRKRAEENRLRAAVEADPGLRKRFGGTWDEVAAAYKQYATIYKRNWLLERNPDLGSRLLEIARYVLRYAEEKTRPDGERLREYVDSGLPSLEQQMYSPAPITDSMEIAALTDYFRFIRKELGATDPIVKALLGGSSPAEAARAYVGASKLKDVAERKRLARDLEAVHTSDDGMIRLARILDGPARKLRQQYEDSVEAVIRASASQIAQARFAISGTEGYPDATFTLRLSYAPVKGYANSSGKPIPYATDIAGLYRRATGTDPFRLPPSWLKAKNDLELTTPFNFVTTNDTHGGNSGSPTINTAGEVIGILFDGNLESLPNRFVYTDERSRSVHVASQGIVEALRTVYRAGRLLKELGVE